MGQASLHLLRDRSFGTGRRWDRGQRVVAAGPRPPWLPGELSSAQRAALAAAEQMERVAEVAEDVLMHPSETPMLLENLRLGSVLPTVRLRSGHLSGETRPNVLQKEPNLRP